MVTLLVVMVPAAALGTPAAQQGGTFMVSVAGTAVGSVPHQIDLKVTQLPGGQLSEVTGFIVSPEDVVQVKQGENLIVSTSPDLRTNQVTVRNIQSIPADLIPLPNNAWSLQGLLPGIYTLDVIVDMSSSGILGTYETILVILAPDQQPIPPTTIINQITIRPPPSLPPPSPPCDPNNPNATLVNGKKCPTPPSPPSPPSPPCDPNNPNATLVNGKKCPTPPPPPPPPPPPCDPNNPLLGEECVCPPGTTGTPPNCIPIDCDVENPPPECGEPPIECPDGSTVLPGEDCPEPAPPLPAPPLPPDDGEVPPVFDDEENGGSNNGGGGGGGNENEDEGGSENNGPDPQFG